MAIGLNIWKTAVGVEVTETELRVAIVRVLFGRFRLQKCLRIEGFAALTEDQKEDAIAKLAKTHKIPGSRVYLSLPRDNGLMRQLEFPVEVLKSLKTTLA